MGERQVAFRQDGAAGAWVWSSGSEALRLATSEARRLLAVGGGALSVQIPPHRLDIERVAIPLKPTGKTFTGSVRYGDYFQGSSTKGFGNRAWWVFSVNNANEIELRSDGNEGRKPVHCQVTEAQLRTCFTLTEERTGGRAALKALPKEALA